MNAAWLKAAVLIALIPAAALAQPGAGEGAAGAAEAEMEAPFSITINHVPRGDVILVLRGAEVFIDRSDLRAAGLDLTGGEEAVVAERKLLRLGSVSPPLRFELDEQAIELRIFAPPELLQHTAIDLAARPPDIEYRTDTSAFLNYAPRVDHRGRFDMYEEMGLSLDGALLFSSAYLSNQRDPVRGLTNLVLDHRPSLLRFTLGDALVRTGVLGSGGFVGGMTISRDYELDPYAIKTPRIGLQGSTPTPATVDVLLNGTRVRSEEIAPGTFEIKNLNVGGGSGLAGYVIRDVFGNEQYVASPFYASADSLNAGVEEYSYSVGALRNGVGSESWDYDTPVAFAYHRRGLTEHFTLGGRGEASDERVSAGPSLTAIAGLGQIDVDLGASYDTDGAFGGASQLAYTYASRVFGVGLIARASSHRYSTVDLAPEEDRTTAALDALFSVPVGSRVTLTYRSGVASTRDQGVFTSLAAQSSVRVLNALNWLILLVRTKREHAAADWEITTTLSYSFARGYSAQASAEVGPDHEALRLQTSKALPSGEGFGYRATAAFSERISGDALLQYQALFGRYGARVAAYEGQNPDLTLDAAGSVVVVPGAGVFASLPVQSAFGLIRVPGVAGVRGYGNHQELGRTDRNGHLIVPNLLSYYGNHLSIAPEDVPLEYELASTETVLAPPPRGVALAEFRVAVPHFYRGRMVVVADGGRVVPKFGQVRIAQDGGEAISPLGQEGEFELSDLAPGSHAALIEWTDGTCEFELVLPQTEETVIELGELTCTSASTSEQAPP